MNEKSTPAKGLSFQLRDADGTIMDVTCGTFAACDTPKGAGIVASISVKYYQIMTVILLKPLPQSSILEAGTTPGLQYPARIVRVSADFTGVAYPYCGRPLVR